MKKALVLIMAIILMAATTSFAAVLAGAVVPSNGVELSDNITVVYATGGSERGVLIGDNDYGNSVCTVKIAHSFTDSQILANAKKFSDVDAVTEEYVPYENELDNADYKFEIPIVHPKKAKFVFITFYFTETTPTNKITNIDLKNE